VFGSFSITAVLFCLPTTFHPTGIIFNTCFVLCGATLRYAIAVLQDRIIAVLNCSALYCALHALLLKRVPTSTHVRYFGSDPHTHDVVLPVFALSYCRLSSSAALHATRQLGSKVTRRHVQSSSSGMQQEGQQQQATVLSVPE
jgi:hypothetical protein